MNKLITALLVGSKVAFAMHKDYTYACCELSEKDREIEGTQGVLFFEQNNKNGKLKT